MFQKQQNNIETKKDKYSILPAMGIRPRNMFWKHNQHHSSSVSVYTAASTTTAPLSSDKQGDGGMEERNNKK